MPSRSSSRPAPTRRAVSEISNGIVRARRLAIAQGPGGTTFTPAVGITFFICKNVGANAVRINFNSQGNAEYWELAPAEVMPVAINIVASTNIFMRGITGASTVECFLWG